MQLNASKLLDNYKLLELNKYVKQRQYFELTEMQVASEMSGINLNQRVTESVTHSEQYAGTGRNGSSK